MNSYLKDNLALTVGISLPLVLILIFFLAGNVSRTVIDDPAHDVVFAADYYPNGMNRYKIDMDQGDIIIRVSAETENQTPYNNPPALYVFDHATLTARKIDIDFTRVENGVVTDPDLAALNEKRIDSSPASPDGYIFEHNYHNNGIFPELFGFGSYPRYQYALKKNSRIIPVTGPQAFYQAHFLGWVINE